MRPGSLVISAANDVWQIDHSLADVILLDAITLSLFALDASRIFDGPFWFELVRPRPSGQFRSQASFRRPWRARRA
jgi:hypothetical protein